MLSNSKLFTAVFILISLIGCHTKPRVPETTNQEEHNPPPPPHYTSIEYVDSGRAVMNIDITLSYIDAFTCDSAIAVDYEGMEDNKIDVLDENGRWLNSVRERKKLTQSQLNRYTAILGNPLTYKNGRNGMCFIPHLALVYYKKGRVQAQTAICLSCCHVASSVLLGDGSRYSSINDTAVNKFVELCKELGYPPYGHH